MEWFPTGKEGKEYLEIREQEVITGMRKKGINNMEWIDREEWRRKINLRTKRCRNIDTLYINKIIIIIIVIIKL